MWMLTGANGYAFDRRQPRFDALVIDGERIVAVGHAADLRLAYASSLGRELDVGGATVIPGLVDSHLHVAALGEQAMALNLTGVRSKEEWLRRVREWAQAQDSDAWIVGGGWDEHLLVGQCVPSISELDAAAGGRPLLLSRVCHHAYLVNHAALARAGLTEDVHNPADGRYGRDEAGRLNGWVYENASIPLRDAIPKWSEADWGCALEQGMRTALSQGITAVHTDDTRNVGGFAPVWRLYHRLIRDQGIRLRVHQLVDWRWLDDARQTLVDSGIPADDWLEVGAAKLFSDGAFGGRTAWLSEPYSDAPGWRGTPMYTEAELTERVRGARERGFPAAIHAIGDAGLAATLRALEVTAAVTPAGGNWHVRVPRDRIVHAELVRPDLIDRMRALGERVVLDVQPRFTVSDFPWVVDRLGPERARYVCAWRTLAGAGLHLAGGSDAPIEPVAPLLGVHAAVTRRAPDQSDGPGYEMQEALPTEAALALYMQGACFANGSDGHKGVIAPGWLADLTVIDRDIVQPSHVDEIRDARVLLTVVGGGVAHAAQGWSGAERLASAAQPQVQAAAETGRATWPAESGDAS